MNVDKLIALIRQTKLGQVREELEERRQMYDQGLIDSYEQIENFFVAANSRSS